MRYTGWGAGNCPLFCPSRSGSRPVSPAPTWGSAQERGDVLIISFLSCCFSFSQPQVPDSRCPPYCLEAGARLPLSKV